MPLTDDNQFLRLKQAVGLKQEDEDLLRVVGERIMPGIEKELGKQSDQYIPLLHLLFSGRYDEAFLVERKKLLEGEQTMPLVTKSFPGGYEFCLEKLPKLIRQEYGDTPLEFDQILSATLKVLLLDIDLSCLECAGQAVQQVRQQRDDLREMVHDTTKQLHTSEAKYRELIDHYPELIIVFNRSGQLVDHNRKMREFLREKGVDAEGRDLYDLVPEVESKRIETHVRRVIEQGHDRIETILQFPHDETRYVEMVSTALYDEEGGFLWARSFLRDLTEKKRFEAEMIKWERLVAVGSMAAKVAHEIRNPLSSISLNVELLQDEIGARNDTDKENSLSLVTSILSEVDRLSTLIEEYLTFGRLPKPSVEPVRPEPFLRNLQEFVRRDFEGRSCEIEINVEPTTPPFFADPNQAKQVLLNLLRNAVDAMPDGGRVVITARGNNDQVLIEVHDPGTGIEKDNIRSIFDPMYTTKDHGTGLGLPFVQQVMREHGGRVTCSSVKDEGTVFSLSFPADHK